MGKKNREPELDLQEVLDGVHDYGLNLATREVYLHSHLDDEEEGGIEYRMAARFIKNMHILDLAGNENILIHFQLPPGGDWEHGMAIFDAMMFAASPITALCHGQVSSMSGIVLQAAPKRVMMPNCEFMIHRGFLSLHGVSTTVQSNADWNKKTDIKMLKIFAKRAIHGEYFRARGLSEVQVATYIDKQIRKYGDWNLDAEEAVYYGLADGVLGEAGFETITNIRN